MWPFGVVWALNMSLPERGKHHVKTQTHRKDSHVQIEMETEIMLPQAKEDLGQPEAGRYKEGSIPTAFGGNMALSTP